MGFRNGDGNEEAPEVEKIELPSDDESTRVSLEEPDADEGDEGDQEDKPQRGDQPRKKNGTWAAKKKERSEDRKAAKAWETERADYDRRFKRMQEDQDRSIRQLREELEQTRRSSQPQGNDPFTSRLADLSKARDAELKLIEADPNHSYARYNEIVDERNQVLFMQALARHDAEQQRQQRNQPQDIYAARRPLIESEYPWVMDDQYRELAQRARAYKDYLVQVERKPDTLETDREALSHVQAHFGAEYGLRPPPAPPSQRTRGLYGAPPTRGIPRRDAEEPSEVDLGVMGQGHGLDARVLGRVVREAIRGK